MSKNRKKYIIPSIFLIFIVCLAVYNIYDQGVEFLKINAGSIVTSLIALFISYYLSQARTDERKQREVIDGIIVELKSDVQDEYLYVITSDTDNRLLLSKIRSILNNIELLRQLKTTEIKKQDIDYIINEFEQYNVFIGDHISDFDYLTKSEKQLKKYLDSVSSKLNKIRLDLYDLQ